MNYNQSLYSRLYQRAAKGMRTALYCILVNILLAAVKILTGIFGNSYALIADGIESVTDVFSSFVVLSGFKIGAKPPDEDHPFGHGRAESMAAFIVSSIVLCAAVFIMAHSVFEIAAPHDLPKAYTLYVLSGVVAVKEVMFRKVWKAGVDSESLSMKADAWHNRSDALTSLAAFIGISIALIGGKRYAAADDWAALFAGGVILWNGLWLYRRAVGELMDEQVPKEMEQEVKQTAARESGVLGVEKCRIRKSGRGYFVELHIEVDGKIPVEDGHEIAHQVKDRLLRSELQLIDAVIHVEPAGGGVSAFQTVPSSEH